MTACKLSAVQNHKMNRKHCCFKRVKKKKKRSSKRVREKKREGRGGRKKKRRKTEEEKAANVLSPQIYGVVSDVHMPKTLAHLELMEATHSHIHKHTRMHAHTHTHTHPCNATATLPEGGRGGKQERLTFQTCKEGGGAYHSRWAVSWPVTKSSRERLRTNNTLGSIQLKLCSQPCDYCYQSG